MGLKKNPSSEDEGEESRSNRPNIPSSLDVLENSNDEEEQEEIEPWVQCDRCMKWRLLPRTVQMDDLPDRWYCELNKYDPKRNRCEAPEITADFKKEVEKEFEIGDDEILITDIRLFLLDVDDVLELPIDKQKEWLKSVYIARKRADPNYRPPTPLRRRTIVLS